MAGTLAEQRAQRDARRQQIAQARDEENARRNAELEVCSRKFAVSACTRQVETQRRAALNLLRDEEVRLNDLDRQQLALEQRERTLEKMQERARREAELAASASSSSLQGTSKVAEQQRKQAQAAAASPATRSPHVGAAQALPKPAAGPTPAQQAANRRAYEERLEAAHKRQAEAARRRQEAPRDVRPLPSPPAR